MDGLKVRSPLQEMNRPAQSVTGIGSLSEDDQHRFNKLITKSKDLASQGMVKQALELNQRALKIYKSDKLAKRIAKMEAYLAQYGDESEEEEEDSNMIHVGDQFYLFRDLYDKLYSHQREGVLWMWKLHRGKKGGILGDDMGLGKTIQVISFLSGLFDAEQIHAVLIVLPVAVIVNWEKEFEKWSPGIRVVAFHGNTKRERERNLAKIHRRSGVVLTSYGMLITNVATLRDREGKEFIWDYIILDEGHKIKNPSTKGSKCIHTIGAKHRLILTGTPVQNNLKEMWALFDWTHQGTLLGTQKTFHMEYAGPIYRARQKDATAGEQRLGQQMALSLQKIIMPYFLRRTKGDVKKAESRKKKMDENNDPNAAAGEDDHKAPAMPTFTRKNDLICWVFLSDIQQKIYEGFVQTDEVKHLLNSSRSPLTALVILKKICDHARLLNMRQCVELGIDIGDPSIDIYNMDEDTAKECAANRMRHVSDETLISESGKMSFLIKLLDNLRLNGHRALIFSQSKKVLNIIQKVLSNRQHKVIRLDGDVKTTGEREEIIEKFSSNKSYTVFLLTTQVGGVGLTLTAADRVVIFDPSWNPATDAQAVDRAFRIGQMKNVVIYRLITCGSIEEKIYRRQIFKDSITRQTTGDSSNPYRYFSRQELHELFVLDNPRYSSTQVQLQELHTNDQRKTDTKLDEHIAFLHSLDMFGISDHDLMFSQEADDDEDFDQHTGGEDYVHSRVNQAQRAITMESEENYQMTQQLGHYPGPAEAQSRVKRTNPFQGDDVPGPSRAPTSVIDLDATGDEEQDSDSESDVNESMHNLTVHDSPPPKPKPVPRSPTPPPSPNPFDESSEEAKPEIIPKIEPVEKVPEIIPKIEPVERKQSSELPDLGWQNIKVEKIKKEVSPFIENGLKKAAANMNDSDGSSRSAKRQSDEHLNRLDKKHRMEEDSGSDSPEKCDVRPGAGHADSGAESSNSSMTEKSEQVSDIEVDHEEVVPSMSGQHPGQHPYPLSESKENQETPKTPSKKGRRSVCIAPTPNRKFTVNELSTCINQLGTPETNIVREEIMFSPKAHEPIVSSAKAFRKRSPEFAIEDEDYSRKVEMNSTVLPGGRPFLPKFSLEKESIVDEESVENSEKDDDNEENDADLSEIVRTNRPQRGVIESSLDEEESDSRNNSSPAQQTNNGNKQSVDVVGNSMEEETNTDDENALPSVSNRNHSKIDSSNRLINSENNQDEIMDNNTDTEMDANASVEQEQAHHSMDNRTDEPKDTEPVDESADEDMAEEDEENDQEMDDDAEEEEEEEEEEGEKLTAEEEQRYVYLIRKSREHYKKEEYMPALQLCLDALEIYRGDERARAYATKLKAKLLAQVASQSQS